MIWYTKNTMHIQMIMYTSHKFYESLLNLMYIFYQAYFITTVSKYSAICALISSPDL